MEDLTEDIIVRFSGDVSSLLSGNIVWILRLGNAVKVLQKRGLLERVKDLETSMFPAMRLSIISLGDHMSLSF